MHSGSGNVGLDLVGQQQLLNLLQAQNQLPAQYGVSNSLVQRQSMVSSYWALGPQLHQEFR